MKKCNTNEHHFVFLAGHHRSGTSLLHEIIRGHPLVSGFTNTGHPEDEGQHLQSVYQQAKSYGGPGKYIFDSKSYMNEHHALANKESAERLMEQWGKHFDSDCNYFIEKSPPNLIRTRFFQSLFPNSKFVVILRHPIAVAYATRKWSRTSIKSLVEHSLRGYEIFQNDLRHLNNVYVLRYEDFVHAPQKSINKVFEFLDLEKIKIHRDVRTDINDKYFAYWRQDRRKLLANFRYRVDSKLEDRFKSFGYSIFEPEHLSFSTILGEHVANESI